MQLTCPTCGQPIRAENINIQEMAAVCSNCDTVFKFTPSEEKSKRRKTKKPEHLILKDDRNLEMAFRTNWRLGSNEGFVGTVIGGTMMMFVSGLLFNELAAGEVPFVLPFIISFVSIMLFYFAALTAFNHTHIVMDEEKISVSRKPLPVLFRPLQNIPLHGVESIHCEETPASVKEGYDLPRYRVWAETADGVRRMIVTDVTEEYAYFISQRLEEKLYQDRDMDVSHLEDGVYEDSHNLGDFVQEQSQVDSL